MGAGVVGRDQELAAARVFLAGLRNGPCGLLLEGEPGIGKTAVWRAVLEEAAAQGHRVLRCVAAQAEARLSFVGLSDLIGDVVDEVVPVLPAPQRRALEVALLRAEPAGLPPEPRAIASGLLNALRALAARKPLLLAVDDVQWLDHPSADALAFAARRIQDREALGFLISRRTGTSSVVEKALETTGLEQLEIGPLTLGATRRMLSERLGLSVSRQLLRRIFGTTLGNPLFALEVGRMLAERGPPGIGEDIPVPDTVEELLGTRVERLSDPVGRLLLAVALSADLHVSELEAIAEPSALEDAVAGGVLLVDGDRVRPSHPLLAAAAKRHSRADERRELHLELARGVADKELRARHLALAAEQPDAHLAAAVAAAAASRAARGAAQDAVELGEHALRLTPRKRAERSDRLLTLGGYLEVAGEQQRVTDLLAPELDTLPRGGPRVRACLLLTGGVVRSNDDIQRYLALALAESGSDPRLRAPVLAEMSTNAAVIRVQRIRDAEAWALEALPAARRAEPEEERFALYALAWASSLRGRSIDDVCERFRAASDVTYYMTASPERVAGQRLVWRGDVSQARAALTRLLSVADERGEPVSYALQRLHVCELELRAGEWDAAARLLDEWAESSERELLLWPMYERCRALLAAGRGLPEETERWAAEAIARAEATGVGWDLLEALRARGIAALLAHEPERASESLGAVWEHTRCEGVDEPGVFPVAPDLVEVLAELGDLGEARAVTHRLGALSEAQEHPWGFATTKRCEAIVRLASDAYDEEAAALLERAAADYAELGLRFDRARSLLVLGRAERRHRKWAGARRSLEQAVAAFEELDSTGWAKEARSELARVGARRPRPAGELTQSEQRVAELAAEGMSNKEIARTLFVSVHTVEVHLSHAYTKLGIHSRGQLARRLSTH
jgi:DNA-binding NarL/FixJ family response regulator